MSEIQDILINAQKAKNSILQMDDFAKCVLNNTPTKVPGELGLRDIKIINAIFESAKTGKRVTLDL